MLVANCTFVRVMWIYRKFQEIGICAKGEKKIKHIMEKNSDFDLYENIGLCLVFMTPMDCLFILRKFKNILLHGLEIEI